MQTSKLLENKRNTYILDVICNRFYFGEVQEEVLGQCCGQGILGPRKEGLSVYQWSVPEKKQAGRLRKCLCKYSTEISRFVLKILEKSKFITSVIPIKMCNTPWKYQGQKRGPLNYVAFLLIILVNSTPFLIHSRKSHML